MLARLSVWVMAVALGQSAPEQPAWLKAVPADVDVVLRSRGLDATRADLAAMLKAMSPALAATAEPGLTNLLNQVQALNGEPFLKTPWVGLIRTVAPAPGAGGGLPYALIVLDADEKAVLKRLAGGAAVELKAQDGGIGTFASPLGDGNWYAAKGPSFVVVGADRALVNAVARPNTKARTLDQVLTPALAGPFLAGDLGLYANVAALATRHADMIEQTRQALMAAIDQAAQQQQGNAAAMNAGKRMYEKLFSSLKFATLLTVGFDFAGEGLKLGGMLGVKPGTDAAKEIAASRAGAASNLGRFDDKSAIYAYFNMNAKDFQQLQGMSLRMLNPEGKATPALDRALAEFGELGWVEASGDTSFLGGMKSLNVINVADPKKYLAASHAMLMAMKGGEGPLSVYKEVQATEGAENHKGFRFDRIVAKLDFDKVAKQNPQDPQAAAKMQAMFGGDTMTYWIGSDGKRVIQATSTTWEQAKGLIDGYLDGKSGLGSTPSFKSVRAALPEQASLLVLLNAQGLLGMFATQLGAKNQPPADLPKEPALIGISLTPRPPLDYEFHFVLPSTAGPVFEKGFGPLFQNLPAKP